MKPLFILPFDHRSGLTHELFHVPYPPKPSIQKQIIALKKVIFDGFLKALPKVAAHGDCGILVDEEFGSDILDRAKKMGLIHAVSTETSGGSTFDFVHKKGFGRALLKQDPTYAKALVNYTIGDTELNEEKMAKLHTLSEFCDEEGIPLMLEPLVHGKGSFLSGTTRMMRDMHAHGVFPSLWKLEMQKTMKDWKKVAAIAKAPLILLGHGESTKIVDSWVVTAAKSGVVSGFAIGRTIFFPPIKALHEKKIDRATAVDRIAKNYIHFVKLWNEHAK